MKTQLVNAGKPEVASALAWLQQSLFPSDEALNPNRGWWWLVRDGDIPVAFAGMRDVPSWEGAVYLARCGVLSKYRGQGLQRKLLATREAKAKALGRSTIITTTYRNPPSANNLIKRGFLTYLPQRGWGAPDTIYWKKDIA